MESKDLLPEIINGQLSSIEFIQDYLQLHFDDKTLTCFIWPFVIKDGFKYKNDHPDYKNQLCQFIAEIVCNIDIVDNVSLTFYFRNEAKILLSLDPLNPDIIGEIAILSDEEHNWSIFE